MSEDSAPARPAPAAESSESEEEIEAVQYKVILLGDGAVGKSSLCQRFSNDEFGKVYKQTIGVDFFLKRIELPGPTLVTLQVWDIGGQTIGGKMLRNYIYGAHAVLLAYDITNSTSFANLEDWLTEAKAAVTHPAAASGAAGAAAAAGVSAPMPYLALVGNKTDLGHLRTVKPQRHKDFADAHGMHSFFVSAKTGDNVATMFYRVAADLAGVAVSKPDMQIAAKVVRAELINHQQNDPTVEAPAVGAPRPKKGVCVIQ